MVVVVTVLQGATPQATTVVVCGGVVYSYCYFSVENKFFVDESAACTCNDAYVLKYRSDRMGEWQSLRDHGESGEC